MPLNKQTISYLKIWMFFLCWTGVIIEEGEAGIVAYIYTYICWIHTNTMITDAVINDARRKTQEDFFNNIFLPFTLLQGFERVVQGLHVRGCWRPNINFIFWAHCYDRHVVSFLFSWCWGLLHRGFPRAPSVGVWLSLPHLVSSCLEFYWQLLWHPT